jgi:hypothetical protein
MKRILLSFLSIFSLLFCHAGQVSGTITGANGEPLPFASITIKGTTRGVAANSQGNYLITLSDGSYTLVCQYVGYKALEKNITVSGRDIRVDFQLAIQDLTMKEVVIKRGEDPALEIIRETIKKRDYYNKQVDSFTVDVYIKGLLRSRNVPDKMLGQKVDKSEMEKTGFDSLGRGILFLSESQTRVSFRQPDKMKYEVISSRQSGGGYGISFPFFINFYTNNVNVFTNLNPRGFISPIADNAFHYYKFHYEGNFFENGKMIDRISVRPKRKNEPLFDGYIQIVDGEWRIHSLDLLTTKDYQLQLIDTARITQIQAPVTSDIWRTSNQVVYLAANTFGFEWSGNFLNVYNNYNLDPGFGKKYFNRTIMSYDTAFNKKDSAYWNAVRPVPLEPDEKKDFAFKDSMYKMIRDSMFTRNTLDSVNSRQRPVTVKGLLTSGFQRHHFSKRASLFYKLDPLLLSAEYNTVEGFAADLGQSLQIVPTKGKKDFYVNLDTRYGFTNHHFNAYAAFGIKPKRNFMDHYLELSGGKRVSQFNHDDPIDPFTNTIYTLFYKRNYIKLYENWFGRLEYNNGLENGLKWDVSATYEDRIPVENTTDYSFGKKDRVFLPNHPYELAAIPFNRHQALVTEMTLSFQPGQRYIEYPFGKMPVGSKHPTIELGYSKGIRDLLGSDVDFDKWKLSVWDNLNLKMGGEFRYRIGIGGFINARQVEIPDFQHFNGNQTYRGLKYLNSFQLAPYYRYSNTEKFYAVLHAEHHFNGLLTNKIPLFNKLKWNLVAGTNTFYVNRNNYYAEAFAGIENIFKLLRVDFITAYQAQPGHHFGVRVGLGGILGGAVKVSRKN